MSKTIIEKNMGRRLRLNILKAERSSRLRSDMPYILLTPLRLISLSALIILCSAAVANAEIYTWTDDQGIITFTDNPARLPFLYSSKVQNGENVIIQIPVVRKKIGRKGDKRLQAAIPSNRIKSTVAGAKPAASPQGMLQTSKGQPGGIQAAQLPLSMKPPTAEPSKDHPSAPPSVMKPSIIPAPPGDQPELAPFSADAGKPVVPAGPIYAVVPAGDVQYDAAKAAGKTAKSKAIFGAITAKAAPPPFVR